MILSGDIGGTKTLFGLSISDTKRTVLQDIRRFVTSEFDSFGSILSEFLRGIENRNEIEAACFGVAGPVREQAVQLTNIPWKIDAKEVAEQLAIPRVRLLNDLEAMGYAISMITDEQLTILQSGKCIKTGNAALIAPGTGLGEVLLHNTGSHFIPIPSEGGHADFSARTPSEHALAKELTNRFGRVSYEQVLSGPGLINIYLFLHGGKDCVAIPSNTPHNKLPTLISTAGLERRCKQCTETLNLFVSALGAEAGNLGLRSVATAGLYLGGGIPKKILPALQSSIFLDAFRAKAPMHRLVEEMPVSVILEDRAALLGAAVAAWDLTKTQS